MSCMGMQEKKYREVTADGAFPEARLYPTMVGSILLPIALFIYAFTVCQYFFSVCCGYVLNEARS